MYRDVIQICDVSGSTWCIGTLRKTVMYPKSRRDISGAEKCIQNRKVMYCDLKNKILLAFITMNFL